MKLFKYGLPTENKTFQIAYLNILKYYNTLSFVLLNLKTQMWCRSVVTDCDIAIWRKPLSMKFCG